jgi:hypothetical protein
MTRDGADRGESDDDGLDEAALEALDAAPLDPDEAASGAERAGEPVGESLAEIVTRVAGELVGAEPAGGGAAGDASFAVGDTVFAVLQGAADARVLDVALDGPVARAALATPDTAASPRGACWVRFAPRVIDRYTADRAEAWLRYAHRRAAEVSRRG